MSRRRPGGGPHPVDLHVGQRLRLRRVMLGLSQEALAERLGISFQQVQKYEKGANRLSASRLHEAAGLLDVPVAFFFENLPTDVPRLPSFGKDSHAVSSTGPAARGPDEGGDLQTKRETLELVRAYYRIRRAAVRKSLLELVRSVGRMDTGGEPTGQRIAARGKPGR